MGSRPKHLRVIFMLYQIGQVILIYFWTHGTAFFSIKKELISWTSSLRITKSMYSALQKGILSSSIHMGVCNIALVGMWWLTSNPQRARAPLPCWGAGGWVVHPHTSWLHPHLRHQAAHGPVKEHLSHPGCPMLNRLSAQAHALWLHSAHQWELPDPYAL